MMKKINKEELFKLSRPIVLQTIQFDSLELVDSPVQGCEFLIAHGVDSDGLPCEERVSTNLKSHMQTPNHVFVRTDDHHAELVAELLDRGLLKKTGHEQQSGFCSIPLMEVMFVRNPLTDSPFV
jgi:hypothetical protein